MLQPNLVQRLTRILFASQSLSALAITSSTTVGTIAAAQLSGNAALAGLASALNILGSALGAYPAGRFMDRYGRRAGLGLGFVVGVAGGLLATLAVLLRAFPLLLLGYTLLGIGRGAVDQGRYAAAEMAAPHARGRAVSSVVLGGTLGAVGGPLVVGPMSQLAAVLGLDPLIGPVTATTVLLLGGSLLVYAFLRPDPRDLSRQIAAATAQPSAALPSRPYRELLVLYPIRLAVAAMMVGQFVMVTLMVITPLYMTHQHHGLDLVSYILAGHVFGMYVPSVVTGRLSDRYGRGNSILLGALVLMLACFLAPLSENLWVLGLALFFLGLGWNLSYVAGSSLLADVLRPAERGRMQGTNDLLVGLVSASGSLGSGVFFATIGYSGIALAGLIIALGLLGVGAYLGRAMLQPQPVRST